MAGRAYLQHPIGSVVADRLQRFNARHPWSHNHHFHAWLLRHLPDRRRWALDVGCGRGELLAELAPHFGSVHGTDLDADMRAAASERCAGLPNVTVGAEQLADLDGPFDLVTLVAVLHHLDALPALRELRRVLAPGGRLLIVGLAPPVSWRDHAWDVASALTNPLIGLWKSPRARPEVDAAAPAVPVAEPTVSFDELGILAAQELPGARLRHRLAFRYTLEWTKPE